MRRDIARLKDEYFDILVIGGGINGCAIARDAALRGAKTALIEKNDFACGASGKTTKLIHGGVRYLEQFDFKLVYECLHERAILLKTAGGLVKPLEFIIPAYRDSSRSLFKIKTGVFLYGCLAGRSNIAAHHYFNQSSVAGLEPHISRDNLLGGVCYYDAQVDDVRLCLGNAISAYQAGACVANKLEVVGFIKDKGRITGVQAKDHLTPLDISIRAKIVVNVTGAWSNGMVRMDSAGAPPITRPTKGIHLIYRKLPHNRAILFFSRKDGRPLFVIPWHGATLIGSTDDDYSGSADEVYAHAGEIDYLLDEARWLFPGERIDRQGVLTAYAALRPLVNTQGQYNRQVSREHLIQESRAGLISVVGGKYTTYRLLAQQTVDLALKRLAAGCRHFGKCVTMTEGPFSPVPAGKDNDLRGRIECAVNSEMANSLIDFLVRRIPFSPAILLDNDLPAGIASFMAGLLGWSAARLDVELRSYYGEIKKNFI